MSTFVEFLKIVVFGLVEGFSEWLPIDPGRKYCKLKCIG